MIAPTDGSGLEPRDEAEVHPTALSPEAERLLRDVVARLARRTPSYSGAVAPVLGDGVLARLLRLSQAPAPDPSTPHIDERR